MHIASFDVQMDLPILKMKSMGDILVRLLENIAHRDEGLQLVLLICSQLLTFSQFLCECNIVLVYYGRC